MKLIEIRISTYINSATRQNEDYCQWEDQEKEHELMFWPNSKILTYLPKYKVNQNIDQDVCNKEYPKKRDFTGLFTGGCGCESSVTYGYEILKGAESAKTVFRLLMCRDVDLNALEYVIYDNGK